MFAGLIDQIQQDLALARHSNALLLERIFDSRGSHPLFYERSMGSRRWMTSLGMADTLVIFHVSQSTHRQSWRDCGAPNSGIARARNRQRSGVLRCGPASIARPSGG